MEVQDVRLNQDEPNRPSIPEDRPEVDGVKSVVKDTHITNDGMKIRAPHNLQVDRDGDWKTDDWRWPVFDQVRAPHGRQILQRREQEKSEVVPDTPFEVIYEQNGPIPDTVVVKLISRELIEIARKCLLGAGSKGNLGLDSDGGSECGILSEKLSKEKPKIDARDMYIALTALKDENESIQQDATASAAKKWPLKHLLRFLESHFKETTTQVERTNREKRVSYDLLWAFLHRGVMVSYTCAVTDRTLQGIVRSSEYQHRNHFLVHLECRDYNGYTYVKGSVTQSVAEFKGEVLFDGIGISPMSLLDPSTEERLLKTFLDNGTKFYEIVALQQSVLMEYEGPSFTYSRRSYGLRKQKADGRVMVDLLSFARMNPEYDLGNATPPKTRNAPPLQCDEQQEKPSPEELRLAPALVYGFSFANKKWAAFDINGLSTVEFDDEAFDRDLVLADQRRKEMLLALVRQYVGDHGHVPPKLDPISKKGDGCVFLCFGPPGTGKTLTAESIAEKLHRPLWSVSVSELGSTSAALETNLMEILDIASQWRAVLLLDEADLYLEKRTSNADPNRIAMTSIFLRVLEYYRGVLFLTTNRVTCFDDAFCSRISMFLRFRSLSESQREEIWKKLLSRAGVQNPDLELFKKAQLNGREIRNCIRVAQTWAMSSGVVLTVDHVAEVMEMLGEVRQDLESAIIEESTERPIARALERVSLKHS